VDAAPGRNVLAGCKKGNDVHKGSMRGKGAALFKEEFAVNAIVRGAMTVAIQQGTLKTKVEPHKVKK